MRINIEIDEGLMREATRLSGVRTKKAAVEAGLRLLVETHAQKAIRRLRGKVQWEGDLAVSRRGRLCSLSILLLQSAPSIPERRPPRATPKLRLTLSQSHSIWIGREEDRTRTMDRTSYGFILRADRRTSHAVRSGVKVISSKENSKEFAEYVASFEHGKVPVRYGRRVRSEWFCHRCSAGQRW